MEDTSTHETVSRLALFLLTHRDALLAQWRTACERDKTLWAGGVLSMEEFNDEVPVLLDMLDQRLRGQPTQGDPVDHARKHGLHRFKEGYSLDELMSEMGHLHQCLSNSIQEYSRLYNEDSASALTGYRQLTRLNGEIVRGSVAEYGALQRNEAASRVESLQQALAKLNEVLRQRGEHLRQSSHDLRGSFGMIQGATSLLDLGAKSDEEQAQMIQMVLRNLATARSVLMQLTDLARLDAGQETVTSQLFNAAALLQDAVDAATPAATEKGLLIQALGPDQLLVDLDPVLIQRILQNLLLTAIRTTVQGWIVVTWAREGASRWLFSIQTSGAYPAAGPMAELIQTPEPTETPDSAPPAQTEPNAHAIDEDLSLVIVRRLCELINARLEVAVLPGPATLFRIRLPLKYHG